jgi:hypothetical protein
MVFSWYNMLLMDEAGMLFIDCGLTAMDVLE